MSNTAIISTCGFEKKAHCLSGNERKMNRTGNES